MRRPSRTTPDYTRPDLDPTPDDWREPDSAPSPEESDFAAAQDTAQDTAQDNAQDNAPSKDRKRRIRIGQFFTGGVLSNDEFTRRLPVIVYIVFLMLLYIANGFHIQHKHNELDRIADELKQLKTRAVTSSAVRMTLTRQSEIERLLREHRIPLIQDNTSPHTIDE